MRLSETQISAARSEGLQYVWAVWLHDGSLRVQFDEGGRTVTLSDLVIPGVAPFTLEGVRVVALLPVVDDLPMVQVHVRPGEGAILFRRGFAPHAGSRHLVYCVGIRRGAFTSITYVSPPVLLPGQRYAKLAIENSSDPNFQTAYERALQKQEV